MALTHVSASQIKDFKACNRLWYYTRILKQRAPQTEAQSRGTTVHGALEAHLKAGAIEPEILERAKALGITEKDLSEYVASMMPFVGKPGEGLTEFRDSMPTYEGGPEYVLVVDHAREIEIKDYGVIPQIDDLKTTSDFRYCKTPDELSKDVQMVSYAKWALWRLYELKNLPQPNFVSLRHVYVRTRGKRLATARDVLVTPADVEIRWQAILEDVRDMVSLAELATQAPLDPQDVPATVVDHCSAYGGCFFRAQCFGAVYDTSRPFLGLFNKEKKETVMADSNVLTPEFGANGTSAPPRKSLKDRVAERHAAAAGGAAPAAVAAAAPVSAPQAAPAPAAPVATCGAVLAVFPNCPCTLVLHEGDHESRGPTGGAIRWNQDGSDFGVGASKNWKAITVLTSVPMTQAPVVPAAPTAAAAVAAFSVTVAQVLPPDAASRISTPEEVAAAGASKRKRATKAEMEARAAGAAAPVAPATAPVAPAAMAAPATLAAIAPTLAAVAAVCKLEELYIDCMPTKGLREEIGIGADIIAPSAAETAASAKVPDYRFIQYNSKPALATVLRSHLDQIPRVVVISSSVPGADVLIEVLTPHAKRVVQALRG